MKQVPNTILLVEDEPEIVEALTEILEVRGYEVISVDSGRRAWQKFLVHYDKLCAVMCDGNIVPSRVNPVRLVKLLRKFGPTTQFIPISSSSDWNEKMLKAGASGPAIQKPIDFDALFQALPKLPVLIH